jgi:hypothetical protein
MRGFWLRALPACAVACALGCFSTNGLLSPAAREPATPTHAYWQGASAALAQRPATQDLPGMLAAVRAQADALRALDPAGVDPDLVAAVNDVIKQEEKVLSIAETADNKAEIIRASKGMALAFQEANKAAAESKKRLRALRDALNAKHGGGFAAPAG